jgi:mRNA interferase RelE/StbE
MKVLYEKSFLKDIEKLNNKKVLNRISETIDTVKLMPNLGALANIKKLKGHASAFRIRIGDYRLGFFYENDTVIFSRFLHRREIYGLFP